MNGFETLRILWRHPPSRRLLIECVVVGILIALLAESVIAPALQSAAPATFPAGLTDNGGCYRVCIETRLDTVVLATGCILFSGFFYWRFLCTSLGDEVREYVMTAMDAEQ